MRRTSGSGVLAAAIVVVFWGFGIGRADADPDALWTIVHDRCVPDQRQHNDPAPCATVDLSVGDEHGYAVLKDINGATQFLLIPTERISGIESPAILAPGATNYLAAAWRARSFVDERAGQTLPRDWVSLAVNSEVSRSQNQLHIHIDCVRADVHEALTEHVAEIGAVWTPFPVPLAGHLYRNCVAPLMSLSTAYPCSSPAMCSWFRGLPSGARQLSAGTAAAPGFGGCRSKSFRALVRSRPTHRRSACGPVWASAP